MSCLLPVHSCQLYSFPSSAQLCFAGSWTLPATLPRILPTDYLLDPGRGAHWHVSGRWEEERPWCLLSLLPAPCPAVEAAGGSGLQGCWPFRELQPWVSRSLCSSSGNNGRSKSRCRHGQFQGGHSSGTPSWFFLLPVVAAVLTHLPFFVPQPLLLKAVPYFKPPFLTYLMWFLFSWLNLYWYS